MAYFLNFYLFKDKKMEFNAMDVAHGDCFGVGIPRTSEQVFAVRNLKIPADFVRKGVVTVEQYEKYKSGITVNPVKEQPAIEKEVQEEAETSEVEMTLEDIQAKYIEKFGKLPARYKNDLNWLVNKLNS